MARRPKKKKKRRGRGPKPRKTMIWKGPYTERFFVADTDGNRLIVETLSTQARGIKGARERFSLMTALRAYLHAQDEDAGLMPVIGAMYERESAIVSRPPKGVYLSQIEGPMSPLVVSGMGSSFFETINALERIASAVGLEEIGCHGSIDPDQLFLCEDGPTTTLLDGIGLHLFDDWGDTGARRMEALASVIGSYVKGPFSQSVWETWSTIETLRMLGFPVAWISAQLGHLPSGDMAMVVVLSRPGSSDFNISTSKPMSRAEATVESDSLARLIRAVSDGTLPDETLIPYRDRSHAWTNRDDLSRTLHRRGITPPH